MNELSESDRRINVEGEILAVVSKYGGARIVADNPAMSKMVAELRLTFDELVMDGRFLPTMKEMRS